MSESFYANVGYWTFNYQSNLYPWKGSGLDDSLGFNDARCGYVYILSLPFANAYVEQWTGILAAQQLVSQQYNDISGAFRSTARF
jgi:hypothetical protein